MNTQFNMTVISVLTILVVMLFILNKVSAKDLHTEIVIKAGPEKVWSILMDFKKYPEWNPFIKKLEGVVKPGNTIKVRLEPPGAKGMTFTPKVQVLDSLKKFQWQGHLFIPGLFDGRHSFELIDNGDGTTTFRQSEHFTGVLLPLLRKMIDKNTSDAFIAMNKKIKDLAEGK